LAIIVKMAMSQRILKETEMIRKSPIAGIDVSVDPGNARYFHVKLAGPSSVILFLFFNHLIKADPICRRHIQIGAFPSCRISYVS
jgi:hypothetical protein